MAAGVDGGAGEPARRELLELGRGERAAEVHAHAVGVPVAGVMVADAVEHRADVVDEHVALAAGDQADGERLPGPLGSEAGGGLPHGDAVEDVQSPVDGEPGADEVVADR